MVTFQYISRDTNGIEEMHFITFMRKRITQKDATKIIKEDCAARGEKLVYIVKIRARGVV